MTLALFPPRAIENILPTPVELQKKIPLSDLQDTFIQDSRRTVEAILNGEDRRCLLIAGPCSIHDLDSTLEYAHRFRDLSEKTSDKFFLIMRAYFEKPRTLYGWKGMLYDPDIDGSYDVAKGVIQTRQLLAKLAEMEVPTGSEFLEINTSHYYSDFLTWGCVGARTSSSPPHRQLAATLNLPVGFKNSVDGNIDHSINGVLSAALPHTYLGLNASGQMSRIQAKGNPSCHIVLRGGLNGSNYSLEAVKSAVYKCRQANIRDKIVIDCSHDNCGKKPLRQMQVFESIIEQILEGNEQIGGLMLESHLYGGSQHISFPLSYGVSITDPCIDWETTEALILNAHKRLIVT